MTAAATRLRSHSGPTLTLGANALALVVGLATGVVSARGLDPSDRGLFLAVILWSSTVGTFALVGLDQALVYGSSGDEGLARAIRRTLGRRIALQAVIGFFVALVVNLAVVGEVSAVAVLVSALGSLTILTNALTQVRLGVLLVGRRMAAWNGIRLVSPAVYLVALLGLFLTDELNVLTGVGAYAAGSVAALFLSVMLSGTPHSTVGPGTERHLVTYGRRLMLTLVPAAFGPRLDQLMLGAFLAPTSLGIYAVAVSVASLSEVLRLTVEQLMFPHYVSRDQSRAWVRRTTAGLVLLTGAASGALLLIARPLIGLVYGSEYVAAIAALPWLLVAASLRVGIANLSAAAKASGRTSVMALTQFVGLFTAAAMLSVMVPLTGAVGAAIAVMVGQAAAFVFLWCRLPAATSPRFAEADRE